LQSNSFIVYRVSKDNLIAPKSSVLLEPYQYHVYIKARLQQLKIAFRKRKLLKQQQQQTVITMQGQVKNKAQRRDTKLKKEKLHVLTSSQKQEVSILLSNKLKRRHELKYFDVFLNTQNSTATVGISLLTTIPQGVTQSQRVGDSVRLVKMEVRFNVTLANSDIYAIMRWFFFRWRVPTSTANPTGALLFSLSTTQGVYTTLNYENKSMYTLISQDFFENLSGIATAPTNNSQINRVLTINLNDSLLQFELGGVTTGTGHLFFTNFSNSAIAPQPVYTFVSRVWYYDED
jgi:hypothetical protein